MRNIQLFKNIIVFVFIIFPIAMSISAQVIDTNSKMKNIFEFEKPDLMFFGDKSSYRIEDSEKVFLDQIGLKEDQSLKKIKSEKDSEGFTHEKFQLYYHDIKVEFTNYIFHSKSGKLISMSGESYYNFENIKTEPLITENEAFIKVINYIGAKHYLWEYPEDAKILNYTKPKGELVLLPLREEIKNDITDIRLSYKYEIYATKPLSRGNIYIDAITGNILLYNTMIRFCGMTDHEHATRGLGVVDSSLKNPLETQNAATRYSGSQSIKTSWNGLSYILLDETRGKGIETNNAENTGQLYSKTSFSDLDNNWTSAEFDNVDKDNAALDVHWGSAITYDYWKTVHKRNSYDNLGAKIRNYVHYNFVEAGSLPSNANGQWTGNAFYYGDGRTSRDEPVTSLDVIAHEIGHAVTQHTADLIYQKESGALNEAFSDIWAACVEHHLALGKSIWVIGEDFTKKSGGTGIRSMSNPKSKGQPDTYKGIYWTNSDCMPTQSNDYCGVHKNSGVLNHWF